MSIYRAFDPRSPSDLHPDETMEESLVIRRPASQMSIALEEHKHLRNAAPADKLLPRTSRWVASLPPNVQPTALLRHYPRIANVLAATWGHATSLQSYINCLFNDNRGTRRGFPPEVLSELVALKRHHDALEARSSADQATTAQ